jgi:hypothetical protein
MFIREEIGVFPQLLAAGVVTFGTGDFNLLARYVLAVGGIIWASLDKETEDAI